MDKLLAAIRESPLSYLPEVSLSQLFQFRQGYSLRRRMEGSPYEWQIRNFSRFGAWVQRKFQIPLSAVELAEPVVLSFSSGEGEAFRRYFELIDEFSEIDSEALVPPIGLRKELLDADSPLEVFSRNIGDSRYLWSHGDLLQRFISEGSRKPIQKTSFLSVIRPNRFQFGAYHFLDHCAFIMGDEYAYGDLKLSPDEVRTRFREFVTWVESEKRGNLSRRWFKVILHSSNFRDCLCCPGGAFSRYCELLDEYARMIESPQLFRGPDI